MLRFAGAPREPPVHTMEEVGATLGETQRFECQVIGFPTPTIRWFKDEVDITDNHRYHVDYEADQGVITLVIRNVTLADEGLYQCRAENSEGYATTTAFLVVKGSPLIRLSVPCPSHAQIEGTRC